MRDHGLTFNMIAYENKNGGWHWKINLYSGDIIVARSPIGGKGFENKHAAKADMAGFVATLCQEMPRRRLFEAAGAYRARVRKYVYLKSRFEDHHP